MFEQMHGQPEEFQEETQPEEIPHEETQPKEIPHESHERHELLECCQGHLKTL